jgi:hypothetical protein
MWSSISKLKNISHAFKNFVVELEDVLELDGLLTADKKLT